MLDLNKKYLLMTMFGAKAGNSWCLTIVWIINQLKWQIWLLVKSIILCKILYNVLSVSYWSNLIYFFVELSHSSWRSIRTAPINRLAESRLGKIRMIFSLRRISWFSLSRRLVLLRRLWPSLATVYWKASSKPLSKISQAFEYFFDHYIHWPRHS